MISLQKKQRVILMHLQDMSNREIASVLHMSKDTVNKYVNEYDGQRQLLLAENPKISQDEIVSSFMDAPKYDSSNRQPVKMTQTVVSLIQKCLDLNAEKRAKGMKKQQMKIIDIHAYLHKLGYDVSYSSVKRQVRKITQAAKEAYVKQSYSPGDICEFDWGTVKLDIGNTGYRKYQMAVFTAAASNYRFAKLFRKQDTLAFQESHADFFEHCSGTFHWMVYDNMRVAVRQFVGTSKEKATDALNRLSVYYGFDFRFCNVRSGNEKGHVEQSVEYVRRKAFSSPDADSFATLEEANVFLAEQVDHLNRQKSGDKPAPYDVFMLSEKAHLIPPVQKFECCIRRKARVDKFSTVSFQQNHYSVPDLYVEDEVELRIYGDHITVYKGREKVAEHPRGFGKDQWMIDLCHYVRTLKRKPGALAGSTAMLQADAHTKNIYEQYYSDNTKGFLDLLPLIRDEGPDRVEQALRELERLTISDKSPEKVSLMCQTVAEKGVAAPGVDRVSIKTQQTLSDYNLLMKAQKEKEERIAV